MTRRTEFSSCRTYRYTLWRQWGSCSIGDLFSISTPALSSAPYVMFIGLNPSTADETNDDPTIRRCMDFTRRWGYQEMVMTNLFAFRATDPRAMLKAADPIGPDNDKWLAELADAAALIIAAWGTKGNHRGRHKQVRKFVPYCMCLRENDDGSPEHPLYIPAETEPVFYQG